MKLKRLLCFLTMFTLLSAQGISAKAAGETETAHFNEIGQIKNAMEIGSPALAQASAEPVSPNPETSEGLPASFDLRSQNLVSSVKNQGNYAICWAVAAASLIETEFITKYPDIDLSEWQLAYYTYSRKFGFPLPETSPDPEDAFAMGGNYFVLSPMLLNWISPFSEAEYPFGRTDILNPDLDADTLQKQSSYHVTDCCILDYDVNSANFETQMNDIKTILTQGHAVAINYYNATSNFSNVKDNQNFYNPSGNLQGSIYHAVTIVGWDDNYSAENFKSPPPRNGAWLCKNSWGSSWGNDGYFWLSYAEPTCVQPYYVLAEEKNEHNGQFYYDDFCWWSSVTFADGANTAYMANVFTAEKDTILTSAMFATAMENENYEIQVYQGLRSSSKPTSGTSTAGVTTGTEKFAGYHTVDLANPVKIQAGETFSIIVKLSGAVGSHLTCESYAVTTTEYADGTAKVNENIKEEQLMQGFAPKQSFYSADGSRWSDIYYASSILESYPTVENAMDATVNVTTKLGNVCVRGLTQLSGDTNLDGLINAQDAADILLYAVASGSGELPEQSIQWQRRADVDNNGIVNANDAAYLLQIAAQLGTGEQ